MGNTQEQKIRNPGNTWLEPVTWTRWESRDTGTNQFQVAATQEIWFSLQRRQEKGGSKSRRREVRLETSKCELTKGHVLVMYCRPLKPQDWQDTDCGNEALRITHWGIWGQWQMSPQLQRPRSRVSPVNLRSQGLFQKQQSLHWEAPAGPVVTLIQRATNQKDIRFWKNRSGPSAVPDSRHSGTHEHHNLERGAASGKN